MKKIRLNKLIFRVIDGFIIVLTTKIQVINLLYKSVKISYFKQ